MNLFDRLRKARELRGLTRQQLAEKSSIALSSLYFYEKGERIPSADALEKISKALEVSVAYFFGEIDSLEITKDNEIPEYLNEQLSKIKDIQSENLPDKLEEIGKELIDISKKLKNI